MRGLDNKGLLKSRTSIAVENACDRGLDTTIAAWHTLGETMYTRTLDDVCLLPLLEPRYPGMTTIPKTWPPSDRVKFASL